MDDRAIAFRPVLRADLEMLRRWMARPHWREWWGEPETEIRLVEEMIAGRDSTRPFLFMIDGQPAGYVQVWRIADHLVEPWLSEAPWMARLPSAAVGVDLSLARAEDLGRGIGPAVLRAFVARLRDEGEREIWIDPAPGNLRAVRAYEKAGFRVAPDLLGLTDDSLLMRHDARAFQHGAKGPI